MKLQQLDLALPELNLELPYIDLGELPSLDLLNINLPCLELELEIELSLPYLELNFESQ